MSFFVHRATAERYARGRPYVHPQIVARIAEAIASGAAVTRALDVGCGKGQSAFALREIATEVIGLDVSTAMLALAPRAPGLRYVVGEAERLPIASGAVGLVTVALALHWFDRDRFLAEARRVLTPGGWLAIYDNAFAGTMREEPSFAEWVRTVYLRRFPSPPRDRRPLTEGDAAAHGFRLVGEETYANDVTFSPDELTNYLTTQSNVIAASEEGTERAEDTVAWLRAELDPLVPARSGTFRFGGTIRFLRTSDA